MTVHYGRLGFLDRLRGLAVLLMFLDHGLLLWLTLDPGQDLRGDLRATVTRFSMPLFMVVSGFFLERTSRRRARMIALVAAGLAPILWFTWPEFSQPEILALWVLGFSLRTVLERFPLETIVLGVLQILHLPVGWPGYEPGLVAVFLAVGVLARHRPESLERLGRPLPGWFAWFGRRSLLLYCGHLLVIAGSLAIR